MNEETIKRLGEERKEKRRKYACEYRKKNQERLRIYKRDWQRNKRKEDPLYDKRFNKNTVSKKYKDLTPERKKAVSNAVKDWKKRNPLKVKAHRTIYSALRNGTIKKQPCYCGEIKVHAHHHDYNKPLDVLWVCVKCHGNLTALENRV